MKEWLVTDGRGGFAMGTPSGLRTRKYHGLYMTIPGRGQTMVLSDIDLLVDGVSLWPHSYRGSDGSEVISPDPSANKAIFTKSPHPTWEWRLQAGTLKMSIVPQLPSGMGLFFSWKPDTRMEVRGDSRWHDIVLRPFFALRDLHAPGGVDCDLRMEKKGRAWVMDGKGDARSALFFSDELSWNQEASWYRNFFYKDEVDRGYPSEEDLHSAGFFQLTTDRPMEFFVSVRTFAAEERVKPAGQKTARGDRPIAADDFCLEHPAGVVAGFPWFGEWGRDTFIALPGLVAARLDAGRDPAAVWEWAYSCLGLWGEFIRRYGMAPNMITGQGELQWDSADATLWYVHALASLWQMSLGGHLPEGEIKRKFSPILERILGSIRDGGHQHLVLDPPTGLLRVTTPHSTWMDARVNGEAVTPRTGLLPEINALWYQAWALLRTWRGESMESLNDLAIAALRKTYESHRPNRIFLHSLPLAPSWAIDDQRMLQEDMKRIAEKLWTPYGLRTLTPGHAEYQAQCVGDQATRDKAYHQGTIWPWLLGHYEMARQRTDNPHQFPNEWRFSTPGPHMLIDGHVPEIFDAEEPFTARGTPGQAWSIATWEEAKFRFAHRLDSRMVRKNAREAVTHGAR